MKKKQGHLFIGGPLDGQWREVPPNQWGGVQTAHFPPWNNAVVDPNASLVIGTQTYDYEMEPVRDNNGQVHEVYVCRTLGVNAIEQLIARYPKKRKSDPYARQRRKISRMIADTAVHTFNTKGYKEEYESLQRTTDAQRDGSDAVCGADNPTKA